MLLAHHTLDICFDIGEKLKDYHKICDYVQEAVMRGHFLTDQWMELTLVDGIPGLALFYGVMDQLFPEMGWDKTAYQYLKLTMEKMEAEGIGSCSLFGGLAGVCFAISACSKQGSCYATLLSKTEDLLFHHVEFVLFPQFDRLLHTPQPISPNAYDLSDGITGVLAYLLTRKEHPTCRRLAEEGLHRLIRFLSQELYQEGNQIPGWYVSPTDQLEPGEQLKFSGGSFLLSTPYGITGCLSLLSLAYGEGIIVPGQWEAIQKIADWLKSKCSLSLKGPVWHHTLSLEEELSNQVHPPEVIRDAWFYGTPAISRSLYLAGKALGDGQLLQFAEESFVSVFSRTWQEWNLLGTSFYWGRAGLLALTHAMGEDTQNPLLLNQSVLLEQDLKRFYQPTHPFGFQILRVLPPEEYRWVDHPGLLNGAAGIALSLLLNHSNQGMNWRRMYLIQ